MLRIASALAVALTISFPPPAVAQDPSTSPTVPPASLGNTARPLYRVFLTDGTSVASYGEWVRVEDRLVFSMPVAPAATGSDLHLVSFPVSRVDMGRTERYAEAIRAAHYAATRGEADFAQLSGEIALALNQVAALPHPVARLEAAETARRSLAAWPGAHHGYRAAEVREIVGVLDGVISGLRASSGLSGSPGRYDLSLSATTEPSFEPLLPAPGPAEIVQNLMTASTLAASPAEKVSLLQSVVSLLDRAVDLLPTSVAATIRATALGEIADERRIDGLYDRVRTATLAEASSYAARADVRTLERLRDRLRAEDVKLGHRRPDEVAAIEAMLDVHLESAQRLRLAHDQWLLQRDARLTYRRASQPFVRTLAQAEPSLDDIRLLAGPAPRLLRPLRQRLSNAGRRLALLDPPSALGSIHAVLRSAFQLAETAVQLRLDAVSSKDVELARQASAAASGALMLLTRGRADLDAAMRPPLAVRTASPP